MKHKKGFTPVVKLCILASQPKVVVPAMSKKKIKSSKNHVKIFDPIQNSTTGFTFVEIIIGVSILIIISTVILGVFRSFDENEALNRDVSNVISVLERARQQTLFSKDSSRYGVHLSENEVVLFRGEFYTASSQENSSTRLHSKVFISNINLPNGTTSVSFKRLSGETDQSGVITLESREDAAKTKKITIEKTGLVR